MQCVRRKCYNHDAYTAAVIPRGIASIHGISGLSFSSPRNACIAEGIRDRLQKVRKGSARHKYDSRSLSSTTCFMR